MCEQHNLNCENTQQGSVGFHNGKPHEPVGAWSRVLVYGMQSSGASLFMLLLAQTPRSIAVVDLWDKRVAPPLQDDEPVFVKAIVSEIELDDHIASFRPTSTILFLRNPAAIIESLDKKSYRDYGGAIEFKLQTLDRTYEQRSMFIATVLYEDLLADVDNVVSRLRSVGFPLPSKAGDFARSPAEIVRHNLESSLWCLEHYKQGWGLGNAHLDSLSELRDSVVPSSTSLRTAERCAPALTAFYRTRS